MTSAYGWLRTCSECGTPAAAGVRYCLNCGRALPEPHGRTCPTCQAVNMLGDLFCEACGAPLPPAPYLVMTKTGLRLATFATGQTNLVLGRSDPVSGEAPDVDLEPYGGEGEGLSRHHVRLALRDNQYWAEDLNSVNLTYLNNQRLAPDRPMRLKDGDLLRLGNLLLTFRAG